MSAQLFKGWLTPDVILKLKQVTSEEHRWEPGRQGTGYEIMPLHKRSVLVREAFEKACVTMGLDAFTSEERSDCYLIRYRDGHFIPPHRDHGQLFGTVHKRLNAIITAPKEGGELYLGPPTGRVHVELGVGDAYVFWPDHTLHEVTTVVGERLLLSVGALIQESELKRYRWSGWPGAFCLDCHAGSMIEQCVADNHIPACKYCVEGQEDCDKCCGTGCGSSGRAATSWPTSRSSRSPSPRPSRSRSKSWPNLPRRLPISPSRSSTRSRNGPETP